MSVELATAYVTIPGDNPLSAVEVRRYARLLRRLLDALGSEVVAAALIGEGEPDLLGPVGEEVDCVREFLYRRVGVPFQLVGDRGRGLALLDSFGDEAGAAEHRHGFPASRDGEAQGRAASPVVGLETAAGGDEPSSDRARPVSRDGVLTGDLRVRRVDPAGTTTPSPAGSARTTKQEEQP